MGGQSESPKVVTTCATRGHLDARPGDLLRCWKSAGFSGLAREMGLARIGLLLGFERGRYQVWHAETGEVVGYLVHEVKDFVSKTG